MRGGRKAEKGRPMFRVPTLGKRTPDSLQKREIEPRMNTDFQDLVLQDLVLEILNSESKNYLPSRPFAVEMSLA
jgi:hypothetical protein